MPTGYVAANIWVRDEKKFKKLFGGAGIAIKKYGGKVLEPGPHAGRLEGGVTAIAVMIEFESKEAANTFYFGAGYKAAKAVREACYDTDFMIIEGVCIDFDA